MGGGVECWCRGWRRGWREEVDGREICSISSVVYQTRIKKDNLPHP